MPRKAPLKVFRTAIGFHDAYVAAPSRRAALQAWGASNDLFAIGAAELVTDPALTEEALRSPGQVITRSRGGLEANLAAAAASPRKVRAPTPDASPRRSKSKPRPRPSRSALDKIEQEVSALEQRTKAEMALLRDREAALRKERDELEKSQRTEAALLDRRLAKARDDYEQALGRWREDS